MVLDYAENGNLYNYLKRHSKLTEVEAFVYLYQTMKAIDYLHKKDILHRDIKVVIYGFRASFKRYFLSLKICCWTRIIASNYVILAGRLTK